MKPTQAQIEAVLRDAKEKLQIYRRTSGDFYEGGVEYTALMKRIDGILDALTAAAEVGPLCDCYFPRREDCDAKLIAATIERCAQVLMPLVGDDGLIVADTAIAAIRALKDRP